MTVIELAIASAVLAVLVLGVFAIYTQSNRIYQTIIEENRMQEISYQIMDAIIHGKGSGKESLIGALNIDAVDTTNFDSITFTDKEGIQIQVYQSNNTIYKKVDGAAPIDLDLNNLVRVSEFRLKYLNPDDMEVTDPTEITKVKITIRLESTSGMYSSTFVSEVKMRNLYKI